MASNDDPLAAFKSDEILIIWSEAWAKAGWDPVILTQKDASSHAKYPEFVAQLKKAKLDEKRWGRYLRYAAMSEQGGGWYAEPFILPIDQKFASLVGFNLPNKGRFTMHESKKPELLSGSEKEWYKMASVMMGRISNNDAALLQELKKKDPQLYVVEESITSSLHVLRPNTDMCKYINNKLAAKFTYKIAKVAGIPRRKYYKEVMTSISSAHATSCGSPVMHTFFEPAFNKYDNLLVELGEWRKAWENAGWKTVVLTMKDAKRHPLFDKFRNAFDAAKSEVSEYNRMCFFRWLAMATSGGGWMSDYDTFPLYSNPSENIALPNNGFFTSFQKHVPALVVGSPSEWDRMSKLLYESYLDHTHEFWSDMLALKEVHDKNEKSCNFENHEVISADDPYKILFRKNAEAVISDPYSLKKYCHGTKGKRAIHFSHAACARVGFCHNKRGVILTKWIDAWRTQCASK